MSDTPMMRAAHYTGPRQVALAERPIPAPGRGEVLLRVRAAGICGSDLHWYRAAWAPGPGTPGHEIGATVEAVGVGVAQVQPGQAVCVEPLARCGACRECLAGSYNHCERFALFGAGLDGGLADFQLVPAYAVHPLPPGVPPEQGNLVEPLAVVLHALRMGWAALAAEQLSEGGDLLVIGAGTVGLAATLVARDAGWRVTTVARYPHQARAARALGAAQVLEAVGSAPTSGFELVADCVGSTEALAGAVAACRPRGAVVALTDFGGTIQFDLSPFFLKGLHMVGTLCYCDHGGAPDFPRAAEILARHAELPHVLVTHRFPLERVADAYAAADDKTSRAIKVVVEP